MATEIRVQGRLSEMLTIASLATVDGGCVRVDIKGVRVLNLPPEAIAPLVMMLTTAGVAAKLGHDGIAVVDEAGIPRFIPGDFSPEEPGATGSDDDHAN